MHALKVAPLIVGSSRRVGTPLEPAEGDTEIPAEAFIDPATPSGIASETEAPLTPAVLEQRTQEIAEHQPDPLDDVVGLSSALQLHTEDCTTTTHPPLLRPPEPPNVPLHGTASTPFTGAQGFTAGVVDLTMTGACKRYVLVKRLPVESNVFVAFSPYLANATFLR